MRTINQDIEERILIRIGVIIPIKSMKRDSDLFCTILLGAIQDNKIRLYDKDVQEWLSNVLRDIFLTDEKIDEKYSLALRVLREMGPKQGRKFLSKKFEEICEEEAFYGRKNGEEEWVLGENEYLM